MRTTMHAQPNTKIAPSALIVMEPGSDWHGPMAGLTNVVLRGDTDEELFARTEHKILVLQRTRQRVPLAALACNAQKSEVSILRRLHLARVLLGVVASSAQGRVLLCMGRQASGALRPELMLVAGSLMVELRDNRHAVWLSVVHTPYGCRLFRREGLFAQTGNRGRSEVTAQPGPRDSLWGRTRRPNVRGERVLEPQAPSPSPPQSQRPG